MDMDFLDRKAAEAFDGFIVRKDLVRQFSRQFPVPTYVVEFLLGRYCATTNEAEIREGLDIVNRQLSERAVKSGEKELFKSRAREQRQVKLIDQVTARLVEKADAYHARLPSLELNDVRIGEELIKENERLLTGGFYAEISLGYDTSVAEEKGRSPFVIEGLRPIQLSKRDVVDSLAAGRERFSTAEWKDLLLRSIGLEAGALTDRQKDALFVRMIPFVERNYNLVEIGPRGTGKSHLFQQISPYAHLVSGGKATVARMFVNNATGQRGLVCLYDVVCFDEISGISFDSKDGVNIMKGYMESGEFSRGKESIRANGSMVMVGNFDVDVEHQQRIGHLLTPLPPEMRDDTAFMDRLHAYLPGWDVPKMRPELFTEHFGLVSDFLSECWSQLRNQSRLNHLQGMVHWGGALSGRDQNAANKTASGLLKLLYPGVDQAPSDDDIEWAVRLALECRRRVKEQQKRIGAAEYRNTHFSYTLGNDGIEKFVATPEVHSDTTIGDEPLEPGQVWALSPGSEEETPGLFRVEVTVGPGSGLRILNNPAPRPFKESANFAIQNLYSRAVQLVGDKDPRGHEFSVQVRAFDAARGGAQVGVATLVALCSALLGKPIRGGLALIGEINLGGSIELVANPVELAEIAAEKGAKALLVPVSARRQMVELSDDLATKLDVEYYKDAQDALLKALVA